MRNCTGLLGAGSRCKYEYLRNGLRLLTLHAGKGLWREAGLYPGLFNANGCGAFLGSS